MEQGLAASRTQAQALIRLGSVRADGEPVVRPSAAYPAGAVLTVDSPMRFVSRGGDKLDGALNDLGVEVAGAVCLDVGASTGGFTDCLLSRGAVRVYAVDVGHGQLAPRLQSDPRVVSREGVNARGLTAADFPEPIDLAVVDASFISLEKLVPALAAVLAEGARVVALIKPQFEVGRDAPRRGRGVVRDAAARSAAIASVLRAFGEAGFRVDGDCDSRLPGEHGNVERFVLAVRQPR